MLRSHPIPAIGYAYLSSRAVLAFLNSNQGYLACYFPYYPEDKQVMGLRQGIKSKDFQILYLRRALPAIDSYTKYVYLKMRGSGCVHTREGVWGVC